jgi:DNA polymerase
VRPAIIVGLGATAAQALIGKQFRVTRQRGEILPSAYGPAITATVHPSSILRAPDSETRARELARFVADLALVARHLARSGLSRPNVRGAPK